MCSMERKDALSILGLAESASDAEINAAYQGKVRAIQQAFARSQRLAAPDSDNSSSALAFNLILQQLNSVYLTLGADASAVHISVADDVVADSASEDMPIPIIDSPSHKKFVAPAAVLVAAVSLAGLYASGSLDNLLDGFSDLDPAVVLAQREQANVLIGDINVLKSQLSAVISSVQLEAESESAALTEGAEAQAASDAESVETVENLPLQTPIILWGKYVQTQISENDTYLSLPETLDATKASLIDDENVAAAVLELESIKNAYMGFSQCLDRLEILGSQQVAVQMARVEWDKNQTSTLPISKAEELMAEQQQHLDNKTACENMHLAPQALAYFHDATQQTLPLLALMEKVKKEKRNWSRYKKRYELSNPEDIKIAQETADLAEEQYKKGLLDESKASYNAVLDHYSSARKSVAGQVAEYKRKASAGSKSSASKVVVTEKTNTLSDEALAELEAAALKRILERNAVQNYTGTLVNIPAGSFIMGDLSGAGDPDELPLHKVEVKRFTLVEHEVTFAQWDQCHKAGRCIKPADEGWGRGERPVIQVSWKEIDAYITWVNEKTGKEFRLPTEAEWEYAARAGKSTKYSWGDSINCKQARFDYYSDRCVKTNATDPVKTYAANAFGLYDIHGNVWEMTSDCWNHNYKGAPNDGSSWDTGDCTRRVLRGGSWTNTPFEIMSANRNWSAIDYRLNSYGFRLAHDDWFDFVDAR